MKRRSIGMLLVYLCISLFAPLYGQKSNQGIARYLSENREDLNLTPADIQDWEITNEHTEEIFGITYRYLRQRHEGISIFNAVATFAELDGRIILSGNNLQQDIASRVNATKPILSGEEAVRAGIRHLGAEEPTFLKLIEQKDKRHFTFEGGAASQVDIPVELLLFPMEDGSIRLVWDFSLYPTNDHWWSMRVDALSGEVLDKLDWVISCDFGEKKCTNLAHRGSHAPKPKTFVSNAHESMLYMPPPTTDQYRVYAIPTESPNHGPRTLVVGPYDPLASPYGWHDDNGVNGNEYTITRGNNVYATEDVNNNDGFGFAPSGGASLNFDFPLNLNQDPSGYQSPAITNLFYMNNIMHDVWHHYGFTAAAGNFQENNYGGGGAASDGVYADAQDGGGTNNANFSTPADGQNPRMQMYLWDPGITNLLTINSPAGVAGTYGAVQAAFGGPVPSTPITANLALFNDNTAPDPNDACQNATNGAALAGKIVVIRRGDCTFVDKVQRAQNAGALAVIMVNNVAGAPITMGGTSATITIPSVMISDLDGAAIIAAMGTGTVNGTLVDPGSFSTDGDLDNGIIAHEYGHGISKRLTGGPSNVNCLTNAEQMGEGWSDWFGIVLTMEPGDQATDNRGVGTYVTGESPSGVGIRPAPYNTNFAVNNYTYAATNNTTNISQPHGIGFVWCTMLWDLTWAMIDRYGFDPDVYNGTGGNNMTMHLVMNALKLQPCSVGFVNGRDAILQADQLLYNGANQCLIWGVFANRGLGYSASQGSAGSRTDQVEAFNMPPTMVAVAGSQSVTTCGNYTWAANGQTYSTSGSYTTTLYSVNGCDSIATLNLTIAPATSGSQSVGACTSYTWPTNGQTYTSSGSYSTLLTNAAGCDSTATLNLTIYNPYNVVQTISACAAYTWPATGLSYSTTGSYVANLTSVNGCDSTVTLNLTMSTSASSSSNASACNSYTWSANGATYTASGSYQTTLMSSTGCDSVVTLNLTINSPTAGTTAVSSCETYTWPANGQTYTSSGAYSATLTNASGCDSVVTLNLTILSPSNPAAQNVSSCESYTWPANGQTYTASGTYNATLTNALGCDSNVVLNLTITSPSTGQETVSACYEYTWPTNGMTYTNSGMYTAVLTNAEGCDSVVTLDLTINTVNSSINFLDLVTLTVNQAGGTYQWLDCNNGFAEVPGATSQTFSPAANGSYACEITYNGCVDTTQCRTISMVGIEDNAFQNGLVLHPNPTSGDIKVELGKEYDWVEVKLFAANGALVQVLNKEHVDQFELFIDTAPGMYLLEVRTSGDEQARIKVMKE